MISHAWYIFGKFNYFDKKKKSNSAIFPKILTSNYILNQIKLFDNQYLNQYLKFFGQHYFKIISDTQNTSNHCKPH